MFKVCIISCGMITNSAHIPAYRAFPEDFEIVAVCDVNEKAARETAERNGIENYYTNAEIMLEKHKPDIVSVCVPNCYHKEYTMLALEHGANVLCEKPLAFTLRDAMEMFDCAKKNGKTLMACQSMRFTPDRIAAKKYLASLGEDEIYYGELSRVRRRGIPTWGAFHMKKISMGGAFIDIGVHMLDALVWLMGNIPIKSVTAFTGQNHKNEIGSLEGSGALTGEVHSMRAFNPDEMDVEDFSAGVLEFENGAVISFKVAWAINIPEEASITLVSRKSGLKIPECAIYFGEDGQESLKTEACPYNVKFPGHMYIADNLRRVLKGEEKPLIAPEETISVSTIIEMFYKSAELKRRVTANEIYSLG